MQVSFTRLKSSNGFSLIELGVVLTVVGLVMGGIMSGLVPYIDSQMYDATVRKQERIARALAVYAQTHYRLPCPAAPNPVTEPFGSPRRSGVNGDTYNATCSAGAYSWADHSGIVPFRALGLSEEDAKDGYGNFFTYQVASEFTGSSGANIHRQCRTVAWVQGSNLNPSKAAFCCPVPSGNSRPVVYDTVDGTRREMVTEPYSAAASGAYAASNVLATPAASVSPGSGNELIAYVLISHGKNEKNAAIKGSASRKSSSFVANAEEGWNGSDTTLRSVSRPMSVAQGTEYFDDIVLWRTNLQMISAFGNNSCARP